VSLRSIEAIKQFLVIKLQADSNLSILKCLYTRSQGLVSVAYIDDCYLQGISYEDYLANVEITKQLFSDLGFIVHNEKSVFNIIYNRPNGIEML
jgi:hypothetical protein